MIMPEPQTEAWIFLGRLGHVVTLKRTEWIEDIGN